MRKRLSISILAALALLTFVGVGCRVGAGEEETAAPEAGAPRDTVAAELAAPAPPAEEAAVPVAGEALSVSAGIPLPTVGPRVIQTASLSLTVKRGSFEEAANQARTVATSLGGFVTSSTASQGQGQRLVRGTLALRVPGQAYAEAMTRLTRVGKVKAREESGQDVSQEFVDLQARARHLEAVETQLLGFLRRTKTVAEALAVQARLNDVQLQLEQLRGQLRYLDDQTAFATISIFIAEAGAPVAKPPKDGGGWGIVDAWDTAARGFVKVVGGAFVGIATAAPVLALLALAFFGWRITRRRRARSVTRSALS